MIVRVIPDRAERAQRLLGRGRIWQPGRDSGRDLAAERRMVMTDDQRHLVSDTTAILAHFRKELAGRKSRHSGRQKTPFLFPH